MGVLDAATARLLHAALRAALEVQLKKAQTCGHQLGRESREEQAACTVVQVARNGHRLFLERVQHLQLHAHRFAVRTGQRHAQQLVFTQLARPMHFASDELFARFQVRIVHCHDHAVLGGCQTRAQRQLAQRILHQALDRGAGFAQAFTARHMDLIMAATAHIIVRMAQEHQAPGFIQESQMLVARATKQRHQRFGMTLEQRFHAVILELHVDARTPHARQDRMVRVAEQLTTVHFARHAARKQGIHRSLDAYMPQLDLRHMRAHLGQQARQFRLQRHMVGAIRQQQRTARLRELHVQNALRQLHRGCGIRRAATEVPEALGMPEGTQRVVAIAQVHAQHTRSVRCFPDELGAGAVPQVLRHSAHEHKAAQAKARQELRHLTHMAEGIRHPTIARLAAIATRIIHPLAQVTDQGLGRHQVLVRQHIARTERQAFGLRQAADARLFLRTHPQVVLQQRRLPVEREGRKVRIGIEGLQHLVHRAHQGMTVAFKAQVPSTVPVCMGHHQS